jgi:FkbH-like protein
MASLAEIISSQSLLFGTNRFRRGALFSENSSGEPFERDARILIIRNTNFELIAGAAERYGQLQGTKIDFVIGAYDDSLSIPNDTDNAFAGVIFFYDADRSSFNDSQLEEFAKLRSAEANDFYNCPVTFVYFSKYRSIEKNGFINVNSMIDINRSDILFDHTREVLLGTPISATRFLEIAFYIVQKIILPPVVDEIKLIVLDLDNTLHSGVLGEDGIEGIELNGGYQLIRQLLIRLKFEGVLLAIASKNDKRDVIQLINDGYDLDADNFVQIEANWDSKSSSIEKISKVTAIGINNILFVDDNPGELARVQQTFPHINLLYAGNGPSDTVTALLFNPGLQIFSHGSGNLDRTADLRANNDRMTMRKNVGSHEEYLNNLDVEIKIIEELDFSVERAAEMSRKTNQFNFALSRLTEKDWTRSLSASGLGLQISYKDRFSDSGVVLSLLAEKRLGEVIICEFTISCRALGRGVDEIIIKEVLTALRRRSPNNVRFIIQARKGERNEPARKWLAKYCDLLNVDPSNGLELWLINLNEMEI